MKFDVPELKEPRHMNKTIWEIILAFEGASVSAFILGLKLCFPPRQPA